MNNLKKIQNTLGYTDYEMAVLKYVLMTLFSELSKLLIFSIFWFHQDKGIEFIFCFLIFLLLRTCSGGLHFNSYISCLLCSFCYFILCINVLPIIKLEKWQKLLLLFFSIFVVYYHSPVVSQHRKEPPQSKKRRAKLQLFIVIFIYLLVMYIMQPFPLLDVGFWCIILHTIQLYIAYSKNTRKEKKNEEET